MHRPEPPPSLPDGNFRIRPAEPIDLPGLERLEALVFTSDRLSRRSLQRMIARSTSTLLVAEADHILGYALVLTRENSRAARLYSLAVDPDAAGRGIGSRLLQAVEKCAGASGADRLQLEVRSDNESGIRFYRKHGYLPFGYREEYYADGMAALRLARPIAAERPVSPQDPHPGLIEAALNG